MICTHTDANIGHNIGLYTRARRACMHISTCNKKMLNVQKLKIFPELYFSENSVMEEDPACIPVLETFFG